MEKEQFVWKPEVMVKGDSNGKPRPALGELECQQNGTIP